MKKIIFAVAAVLIIATVAFASGNATRKTDCCAKNSACCYPGSPCCNHSK